MQNDQAFSIAYTINPQSIQSIAQYYTIKQFDQANSEDQRQAYQQIAYIFNSPTYQEFRSRRNAKIAEIITNTQIPAKKEIFEQAQKFSNSACY